jgi:Fe-S-cluster-containing hydrogenase component 2
LPEESYNPASITTMTNYVRLQHADLARNPILRVVPKGSRISRRQLFRFLPRFMKIESDIPIVLRNECTGRSKSCDYCRRACPVKAISNSGDAVAINDQVSIECGACARECQTGAIQCPSVSGVQIISILNALSRAAIRAEKQVLILTCPMGSDRLLNECRRGKRLEAGLVPIQIPCVASVGSVHHLWSASLGVTLVTVCPDISCSRAVTTLPLNNHTLFSKKILENSKEDRSAMVHHIALDANTP